MLDEKQRKTFLSYSRANKDFAIRLAKELKSEGFDIWLDQLDIPAGSRWDREVEKALKECEIFMIILTPASIDSENVLDEIGYAIDNRKRFLPVLLENCDVPLRLRRFQYVDFTNKSFDGGVESAKDLLRNLIAQTTIPRMEAPAVAQDQSVQAEAERIVKRVADEELAVNANAEAKRKTKEEADRLAKQKAELEAKAEADRKSKGKIDPARQAEPTGKTQRPKWIAILWIALGWAVGFSVSQFGISITMATNADIRITLSTTMVIGGAILGFVTAIVLRNEHVLANWKNTLWFTLNGAISLLICYRIAILFNFGPENLGPENYYIKAVLGGLIGGAIYGFITVIILKNEQILSNRKSMGQVVLFGVFCFAIGRGTSEIIELIVNPHTLGLIYTLYSIGGLIGGAINAYLIFWQISKETNQKKTV